MQLQGKPVIFPSAGYNRKRNVRTAKKPFQSAADRAIFKFLAINLRMETMSRIRTYEKEKEDDRGHKKLFKRGHRGREPGPNSQRR